MFWTLVEFIIIYIKNLCFNLFDNFQMSFSIFSKNELHVVHDWQLSNVFFEFFENKLHVFFEFFKNELHLVQLEPNNFVY
jgi:hypothetical protein